MKHALHLIPASALAAAVLAACGGGSPGGNPDHGPVTDTLPPPNPVLATPQLAAQVPQNPDSGKTLEQLLKECGAKFDAAGQICQMGLAAGNSQPWFSNCADHAVFDRAICQAQAHDDTGFGSHLVQ
jgi:hypothetical protein